MRSDVCTACDGQPSDNIPEDFFCLRCLNDEWRSFINFTENKIYKVSWGRCGVLNGQKEQIQVWTIDQLEKLTVEWILVSKRGELFLHFIDVQLVSQSPNENANNVDEGCTVIEPEEWK